MQGLQGLQGFFLAKVPLPLTILKPCKTLQHIATPCMTSQNLAKPCKPCKPCTENCKGISLQIHILCVATKSLREGRLVSARLDFASARLDLISARLDFTSTRLDFTSTGFASFSFDERISAQSPLSLIKMTFCLRPRLSTMG